MSDWSRNDKFTLIGVLVAIVTCLAALLVVPEFRKFLGFKIAAHESEQSLKQEPKDKEGAAYILHANAIPEGAFKRLREMTQAKIRVKSVAFTPDGGYVIISDSKQRWDGIPEYATEMLREITEPVKQIAFTPDNGWVILYGEHWWKSRGLPKCLLEAMGKLSSEGKSIDMVSLTPNGGWVIVYDRSGAVWESVPGDLGKKLKGMKVNKSIDIIAFTPTGGWLLVYDKTSWASTGIPEAVSEKLDELSETNRSIDVVSFTHDGGWAIIAGSR